VEELKEELKKVSWTAPEELWLSTKVVIASIFLCGFSIYFFDLVIKGVLDNVALLVRFIFG
jgi:preprotein translocase SecE subunit